MTNQKERFYVEEKDLQRMKSFLTDLGFLPYQDWLSVEINHFGEKEYTTPGIIRQKILQQTGYKMKTEETGIYIYEHEDGTIMYIGQGKLDHRIDSHYREVFEQVAGDRSGRFHKYFNSKQGKVKVYIKPTGRNLTPYRVAIESFLIYVLQPEFLPIEFERGY